MITPMIIVHGGAGAWKDERIPAGVSSVEEAARIGFQTLLNGGSAIDAAEHCTLYMESCGKLNAGIGATKNSDGERELDAMIIDGNTLSFGAVAAVRGIANPICLARYIMEKTDYSFFAGEGALRQYEAMIKSGYRTEQEHGTIASPSISETSDTVGCVVIDEKGRIAATSSTGGIRNKAVGRVGDSPVFGSGAYANHVAGASATGYGEHIMRVLMSHRLVQYVENGIEIQEAANKTMDVLVATTGSEAGIVALDRKGYWAKATNAKAMPCAVIHGTVDSLESFIK